MRKNLTIPVVAIVLIVIAGYAIKNLVSNNFNSPVACTMEAKICPDGSAVGRSGPNCEFATCPNASTTVSCTKELRACPDGTSVGRIPPNCDFASCSKATGTTIANPASVNCQKVGGSLVIDQRGDGGQYGLCYFDDNRACEEWAMLRGDCPVGGMKTTGYDTVDQKYCAWAGGQTFAVPNSICIFKNGSKCSTIDFYNGRCLPSN